MPYPNITIDEIFDMDKNKTLNSREILDFITNDNDYVILRRNLRNRNTANDLWFVCEKCGTALELSCIKNNNNGHTYYFKHERDPDFDRCPIKTDVNMTREDILKRQYAFKSESKLHIALKNKVGEIIKKFIYPDADIDKKFIHSRFGDSERRKPDIYFIFNDREITIEFQVNNTFLSIIQERENFYERNKISLMWVFGVFNPYEFQSIAIKDIYIPNGTNAFVFDDEAEQASYEKKTLCLKVWYLKYKIENDLLAFDWNQEIITLDQLSFNSITARPYYFDCNSNRLLVESELEKIIAKRNFENQKEKAHEKAVIIKKFLSNLKNVDIVNIGEQLDIIKNMSELEIQVLNDLLKLDTFCSKDNKNIVQYYVENLKHFNLLRFILLSENIRLNLSATVCEIETTLISILKSKYSSYAKSTLTQLLFSRGYNLTSMDIKYIQNNFEKLVQKKIFFLYSNFVKLKSADKIAYFEEHINKFLIIESAKNGSVTIIGNERQSLIWMANLATTKEYNSHWFYFDIAFSHYTGVSSKFSQGIATVEKCHALDRFCYYN